MKKKKHIEILARGVFVDRGRILLCHTKGADNTYLPGGHVEFGESAKVALCREVKEELGCRAVVGRFLGTVEHSFVQKGRRHCELNIVLEMKVHGMRADEILVSREEYIEFSWVPLSSLRKANLEPSVLTRVLRSWLCAPERLCGWASNY